MKMARWLTAASVALVVSFAITSPAFAQRVLQSISPNSWTQGSTVTIYYNLNPYLNDLDPWYGGTIYIQRGPSLWDTCTARRVTTLKMACDNYVSTAPVGTWSTYTTATEGTLTYTVTPSNPVPLLTSLSPTSISASNGAFTLTINGSNFVSGATVQWNGSARTTTYVNSTQLTAAIPTNDVATAGSAAITVNNPAPGGGTSSSQTFTITNPPPTLTSLSPASTVVNGSPFSLTVTGTNFLASSVVNWNGSPKATTFIDPTTLTAAILVSDMTSANTVNVTVTNPEGTSNSLAFTFTCPSSQWRGEYFNNETRTGTPALVRCDPSVDFDWAYGSPGPAIQSDHFSARWTSSPILSLPATYIWNFHVDDSISLFVDDTLVSTNSYTSQTITMTKNLTAGPHTLRIEYTEVTASAYLRDLNARIPAITALSPPSIVAGEVAFPLTVTGSNYVYGSTVQWNGADRPTTFVSSSQLTAQIPAEDITLLATAIVTVTNPLPGGGVPSSSQLFEITDPPPTLTSLSPTSATVGDPTLSMTVDGWDFEANSVLQWNGMNQPTTFLSGTQISAQISASDLDTAGQIEVTVTNPGEGGGISNILAFTVNNRLPTITGFDPLSTLSGNPSFLLDITGSGFAPGAVIQWNGLNRTTTFVSSTRLRFTVPAADIVSPGTATLRVFNPTPGGGLSAPSSFTIADPTSLSLGALTQDGAEVVLPVSLSNTPVNPSIDCGTTPSQVVNGLSGTCRYAIAGTFTLTAAHDVNAVRQTITQPILIPLVQPSGASLVISSVDGVVPNPQGIYFQQPATIIPQPAHFPVPLTVALTLQRPVPDQVGILDTLSLPTSTLQHASVTLLNQLTTLFESLGNLNALTLTQSGGSGSLSQFSAVIDDPTSWVQRLHFQGVTSQGTPLSADALLRGAIGDGSGIALTIKRIDPLYPYAPGTVSYRIATLATPTQQEPITTTWELTKDGQPAFFSPSSIWTHMKAPTAGAYQVTLTANGPLSGTRTWTDTLTFTAPPSPNALAIQCTAPTFNRPPAIYRCSLVAPPRLGGERITVNPTWTVDGQPAGTAPRLTPTFATAGAHTVSATVTSTFNRTFTGSAALTVPANQPPIGTADCARSWRDLRTGDRHLYCRANASDPDGRVTSIQWSIAETGQTGTGLILHKAYATPQVLTVTLTVTDDSGVTTIGQASVDLGAL
jgi:hypothetical protein